jgi:hypothetical protein
MIEGRKTIPTSERQSLQTSLEKAIAREYLKWSQGKPNKIPLSSNKTQLLQYAGYSLKHYKQFPTPPKTAPENLKLVQKHYTTAKTAPWNLTADSLDFAGLTDSYYDTIIRGAQTPEACTSAKFKPTPEQGRIALEAILSGDNVDSKTYENASWLMAKSGMQFDPKDFDLFKFDKETLLKDIAQLLSTKPLFYKGSPNIAAIKIAKALLYYSDTDFKCGMNSPALDALNWLTDYGDNPNADRIFIAKILRMILQNKKICEQDRNLALTAMKNWGKAAAPVQHEVACSMLDTFGTKPLDSLSFQELFLISQSIGLRSDLNEASWLEQMRAYGEVGTEDSEQIYQGLLKYVLGTPAGIQLGSEKAHLKIPKTIGTPNSIVKLCRHIAHYDGANDLSAETKAMLFGAKLWLKTIKQDLDKPRLWPKGFTLTEPQSGTLAFEFEAAGMQDDLMAIKSDCTQLPPEKKKKAVVAAPKSSSAPAAPQKKKKLKDGDFHP